MRSMPSNALPPALRTEHRRRGLPDPLHMKPVEQLLIADERQTLRRVPHPRRSFTATTVGSHQDPRFRRFSSSHTVKAIRSCLCFSFCHSSAAESGSVPAFAVVFAFLSVIPLRGICFANLPARQLLRTRNIAPTYWAGRTVPSTAKGASSSQRAA